MAANDAPLRKLTKRVKDLEEINELMTTRLEDAQRSYANLTAAMSHLVMGVQGELDRADVILRTTTYVLRHIFGHQVLVDEHLKILATIAGKKVMEGIAPADAQAQEATERYHKVFQVMHEQVMAEQAGERQKAVDAQQAEAKQAREAGELARVEAEFAKGADLSAGNHADHHGSGPPPEVTVFGG